MHMEVCQGISGEILHCGYEDSLSSCGLCYSYHFEFRQEADSRRHSDHFATIRQPKAWKPYAKGGRAARSEAGGTACFCGGSAEQGPPPPAPKAVVLCRKQTPIRLSSCGWCLYKQPSECNSYCVQPTSACMVGTPTASRSSSLMAPLATMASVMFFKGDEPILPFGP